MSLKWRKIGLNPEIVHRQDLPNRILRKGGKIGTS
jgi:hypothetical protein